MQIIMTNPIVGGLYQFAVVDDSYLRLYKPANFS
jgi:hypothetical protein